jgi:hypothetical protein
MSKKAVVVAMPVGGNREEVLRKIYDEIDSLGVTEGMGNNARPTFAIRCVEWAASGDAGQEDAYTLYDRYIATRENASAFGTSMRENEKGEKGRKQNAYKFRVFLKMGGLKIINPVEVINQAVAVVKDSRNKGVITLAPFESLLNIAVAQCSSTQGALSDQEMIEACLKEGREDPEENDAIGQLINRINKHEKKYGEKQPTTEARDILQLDLDAMGGTTKQRKAREKAEAKKKRKVKRV